MLNNGTECRNISDVLTESRHKRSCNGIPFVLHQMPVHFCHNVPVRVSATLNSFSLCLQLNQLQTRKDNTETQFAH